MTPVKYPIKPQLAHTSTIRCTADGGAVYSPGRPGVVRHGALQKFGSFPQSAASQRVALAHSNPFFDFASRSPTSSPTAAASRSSSTLSASLLQAHRTAAAATASPPPPAALLRLQFDAAEALRQRRVPLSPWRHASALSAAGRDALMSPPPPAPPPSAPIAQRKEFVHQQLDSISSHEILDGLVLSPRHKRRLHGGAVPPPLLLPLHAGSRG